MSEVTNKRSWSIPGSHFGGDPEFYSCWTLFDISNDGGQSSENLEKIMSIKISFQIPKKPLIS